ncbi:hypothetical protein EC968_005279 [Mortierella alpina]|nr:hypothetical protein EC968_005279 [Mortierella alpina]
MSEVSTLLAWLIPCLVIALAVVGWRIYVYKTRGPFLPSYLQRNIFERTRSFQPKTPPTTNNNESSNTAPGAIRNETRLDMPDSQQQMSSVSSTPSAAQSFTPVPCEKKGAGASISSSDPKAPVSPAISRVLNMK